VVKDSYEIRAINVGVRQKHPIHFPVVIGAHLIPTDMETWKEGGVVAHFHMCLRGERRLKISHPSAFNRPLNQNFCSLEKIILTVMCVKFRNLFEGYPKMNPPKNLT